MKCAILGNGPSRSLYSPSKQYDYCIGCNIPWAVTDCTVIIDKDVMAAWSKNLDLIKCSVWLTNSAYSISGRMFINHPTKYLKTYLKQNNLVNGFKQHKVGHSSGHLAAQVAIDLGYTEIDLYGFDSYFSNTMESYTLKHVATIPDNRVESWRKIWNSIISSNPDVVFNFIRE